MKTYKLNNLEITVDRKGADRFAKVSYPIRYGRFAEIKSPDHLFQFDLNGQIRYVSGLNGNWPHPAEWLKRTDGNDWVYYSTGGYRGVFAVLGEYYRPCLSYPSNSIWEYDPFADPRIEQALNAFSELQNKIGSLPDNGLAASTGRFWKTISRQDMRSLGSKADTLHRIIGGKISVLPPDTRHVDYNVIPVMIADGCLYQCNFCSIKSRQGFCVRSTEDIRRQIRNLQAFYGANLRNYNALFLGNHDALAAGPERICLAATEACARFSFETSYLKDPTLFLFGSADSFLNAEKSLFESLNRMPMYTFINIGLESADRATLKYLNKPLDKKKIEAAFQRVLDINRSYPRIEITVNFILGDRLPPGHYPSIIELIRNRLAGFYSKGAVYLSPLMSDPGSQRSLQRFFKIKNMSRLPVYLYLIQRL
ncbi:MAG: radical SAM protein [Desulfobacteraceae bacterium]|nr:radical SAM protein [Desulfobacteraceae bacterium]